MNGVNLIADLYFTELERASLQAIQTAGKIEHKLLIGGQPLVVQFAGKELEQAFMPALRHLVFEFIEDPELTLYIWDGVSTGVGLPNLPWEISSDKIWRYQTEQVSAVFLPGLTHIFWLDRREKTAIYWMADAGQVRIVDQGSPLLILWAGWLSSFDIQLVHAAALSGKNGAALLLGKGGSGKSSTALLSLNSPLKYLADDYCLVSLESVPQVFSLYSSGKVNAQDRDGFPWLKRAFAGNDQEKVLFHLYPIFADRIAVQKPLRALLACHVTGKVNTTIEEISPIKVMRSIAPSTLFQLRSMINPRNALHIMAEAVKRVPGYQLNLGTDRKQIPDVLMKLLGD